MWNSRGIRGSSAPGSRQRPSDTMASKSSHRKRGAERAAHQSPPPDDQALLSRQKHKLLQVRERGHPAGPRRSLQPQHWAEGLRPGWPEAPHQRARRLDRLHIAHLLGAGGGWPAGSGPRPDARGLGRRGAGGRPRAREKQSVASRGEKRRQEDPVRPRPRPLKSRRTLVGGAEKRGAGRAADPPHPAPGPPEKSTGKRRSSRKAGSGHRPDPCAQGDLDVGSHWAAASGAAIPGAQDGASAAGRRRSPVRTARLSPGPKRDCPGPSPQGQADPREPLWPGGAPCARGSPPMSPRQRREGSRWKRELESVFRELFSTNRKLRTHLNRYLESLPGTDTSPSEEQGFPEAEACGCRGPWERRAGDARLELARGPAPTADARPEAPSANLKELLARLKDRQYRRMLEPLASDDRDPASHTEEESPPWGSLPCRHEPPRPAPPLPQLHPRAPAARACPAAVAAAAWPQQSPEPRWRPTLVEVLELPQQSWEALGLPPGERGEETTETETEAGAPAGAHPACGLAPCTVPSAWDLEEAGGCECSAPAVCPPAANSEEEDSDDSGQSQKLRDLQEQILEQGRSHRQFLERARRRLQEFQNVC